MGSGFTYMYAGLVAIFVLLFVNLAVARICEIRRKTRLQGTSQVCILVPLIQRLLCDHAAKVYRHEAAATPVCCTAGAS